MSKAQIAAYYRLTKPGIIRGNLITAVAAYLYGANNDVDNLVLLSLGIGTSLIIACGCVLNNIFDEDIDRLMSRTSKRELVLNLISKRSAYIYAATLGSVGMAALALGTNTLTLLSGLMGLVFYAGIYTYAKRRTHHSTLIGTIPGAMPPVAGYLAATNSLDVVCLVLLLILVLWQMPHFLAIAIRRIDDYRAAGLPVTPIQKGISVTNTYIKLYILGFGVSSLLLYFIGRASLAYAIVMFVISTMWLYISSLKKQKTNMQDGAKMVFLFSLIVLVVFNISISLDKYLYQIG